MNKVILMGRLTRNPEVRYGAGENSTAAAGNGEYQMRNIRENEDYNGPMRTSDGLGEKLPFV